MIAQHKRSKIAARLKEHAAVKCTELRSERFGSVRRPLGLESETVVAHSVKTPAVIQPEHEQCTGCNLILSACVLSEQA